MPTVRATFSADISQFRTSLAQASTLVTSFDRTVGQVNRDLARFGNQFSGATIQRQAETMAKAIGDIGGVTRLTDSELKRANSTIQEAIAKYRVLGQQAPADVQRLARELQGATTATRSFGDSLKSSLGNFAAGLGVGAGLSVFQTIGSSLREMAAEGAKLSQLRRPFEALTGGAGQATAELERMREATQGLVSDLDLMQAANKAQLLGLTDLGVDLSDLASVATRLGRAMGQDASKSVDDLTTALGRMSPMILDNLGITVRVEEANQRWAAANNTTVAAMDEQQKKLAFIEAAMEAARAKAATLGDVQLTVADQFTRMGVTISGAVAELASFGNESGVVTGYLGLLNDGLDDALDTLRETADLVGDFVPDISGMGDAFGDAEQRSKDFARGLLGIVSPALFAIKEGLRPINEALTIYSAILDRIKGRAVPDFSVPGGTGRGRDIVLGGTFGAGARSQSWIDEEVARRREELEAQQAKRLKEIEAGMRRTADASTKLTAAEGKRRDELERLDAVWRRMMRPALGVNGSLGASSIAGIAGAIAPGFGNVPGLPSSLGPSIGINQFDPLFKQFGISGAQSVNMTSGLTSLTRATTDWRIALQGVSQAFAQLGQIAGGSLSSVTRGIGGLFASANAAQEMTQALAQMFSGLRNQQGGLSTAGRGVSGGLAGLTSGLQVGSLFSNRGVGFAAGAASGAVTGGIAGGGAFSWLGAGVGALVGGFAGMFAAAANAAARRTAKDLSASQLTAQFGGLENLLDTVGRLGLNQQTFLEGYYGDPKAFAEQVNQLNLALEREKQIVDRLGKSLHAAAQAQGILSRGDLSALGGLRAGGPGDEMRRDFLSGQTTGLVSGLTRLLSNGPVSSAAGAGAGASLGAAFALLREQGVSVTDAIRQMQPAIEAFQQSVVLAGRGSTAEFDALKRMLDTVTSETLGPFVEQALGAGQALSALANTGTITQDMFGGLSTAIADAYYALERDGQGGVEAVRLLQGPLQNIWQLMEDFGLQVDEDTQRLIDFASEAGLIGDQFRPATDRMAQAIDRLIERMDALLSRFAAAAGFSFPEIPGGPPAGDPPSPDVPTGGIPLNSLGAMVGRSATQQTVVVELDGYTLARATATNMPNVLRVRSAG